MKSLSFSLFVLIIALFMGSCEEPVPPVYENPIDTTTTEGEEPLLNPALVIFVDNESPTVGNSVKIGVHARVVEDLSGVHIQLHYDNQKLQYISAELGELFSSSEDSWIFDTDNASVGTLDIFTSYLNPDSTDISGTGRVTELTFEAIASGDATIIFDEQECEFVDAEENEIEILDFVEGVVHVQ